MRFRWLIPFGALFVADCIGMVCAILLTALGSAELLAMGLTVAISLALAFVFGTKVGKSRVGDELTLWDINLAFALYGGVSAPSFDGMGDFLLVLSVIVAKVGAFMYGLQRQRPSFFIKPSASSHLDSYEPRPPLFRRRWLVAVVAYFLAGTAIIVPLEQWSAVRDQSNYSSVTTVIMIAVWPGVVGYMGYALLKARS